MVPRMTPISVFTSVVLLAGAARLVRQATSFCRDMAIADARIQEDDAERAMLASRAPDRSRLLSLSPV